MTRLAEGELIRSSFMKRLLREIQTAASTKKSTPSHQKRSRCGDSPSQLAAPPTAGKPPPKVLPATASAHKRLMISWKRCRIVESTKPIL